MLQADLCFTPLALFRNLPFALSNVQLLRVLLKKKSTHFSTLFTFTLPVSLRVCLDQMRKELLLRTFANLQPFATNIACSSTCNVSIEQETRVSFF